MRLFQTVNISDDYLLSLKSDDVTPTFKKGLPTIAVIIQYIKFQNIGTEKYPIWEQVVFADDTNVEDWAKQLNTTREGVLSRLTSLVNADILWKQGKIRYAINPYIIECGSSKDINSARKAYDVAKKRAAKA